MAAKFSDALADADKAVRFRSRPALDENSPRPWIGDVVCEASPHDAGDRARDQTLRAWAVDGRLRVQG